MKKVDNMKNVKIKCGEALASMALAVTANNVNSACMLFIHQPKLPEGANKLRKF